MAVRVQVILDEKDLSSIRERAHREKVSVSAWMRAAARQLLARIEPRRFRTAADLRAFFKACDARERGREPDWEEHLATMQRSRRTRS
jgi:hypothetical protein